MKVIGLFFVLFSLSYFQKAHAIAFIEPTVGYASGNVQAKIVGSTTQKGTSSGLNYGVRGGLSLLGLQIGADFVRNNLSNGGDFDGNSAYNETAAFLGYRLLFLRLYGAYIFNAGTDGTDGMDPGKGFKVGGTFYAFSNLALNLEYRAVNYDKYTDPSTSAEVTFSYNTLALLLSFPFEI
ncbi:MAG: hypothetical protein K2P81_00285 [Bacteriovoracaceae bacterium]|nr:hypothetical protein [Bacteriovoracaceae bacterium]